jgi:hypothetical protein
VRKIIIFTVTFCAAPAFAAPAPAPASGQPAWSVKADHLADLSRHMSQVVQCQQRDLAWGIRAMAAITIRGDQVAAQAPIGARPREWIAGYIAGLQTRAAMERWGHFLSAAECASLPVQATAEIDAMIEAETARVRKKP